MLKCGRGPHPFPRAQDQGKLPCNRHERRAAVISVQSGSLGRASNFDDAKLSEKALPAASAQVTLAFKAKGGGRGGRTGRGDREKVLVIWSSGPPCVQSSTVCCVAYCSARVCTPTCMSIDDNQIIPNNFHWDFHFKKKRKRESAEGRSSLQRSSYKRKLPLDEGQQLCSCSSVSLSSQTNESVEIMTILIILGYQMVELRNADK